MDGVDEAAAKDVNDIAGAVMELERAAADSVSVQMEFGYFDSATGAEIDSSTRIRSIGYIPVRYGEKYAIECSQEYNFHLYLYDSEKTFLSRYSYIAGAGIYTPAEPNAAYMRIRTESGQDDLTASYRVSRITGNVLLNAMRLPVKSRDGLVLLDMSGLYGLAERVDALYAHLGLTEGEV